MGIPNIPTVPPSIADAAEAGKLVVFVGAGLSRLAGSPGWQEFANSLLSWLVDQELINHSLRAQLASLPVKTRISIALQIAEQNLKAISASDYRRMLMTSDPGKLEVGNKIYRDLGLISQKFVTTNFDGWLEIDFRNSVTVDSASNNPSSNASSRGLEYRPERLMVSNLLDGRVLHIHGSWVEPDSMIMTTAQYLDHYRHDDGIESNPVTGFLQRLFNLEGLTVLFVGYGLEEMEVLEYVLQKGGLRAEIAPRHCMLRGFYSHEEPLVRHLSSYYKEHCGVTLVPFCLDGRDHMQLASVIEDWSKRVIPMPLPPLEKRLMMEGLLNG
jgi:hypothetical protein